MLLFHMAVFITLITILVYIGDFNINYEKGLKKDYEYLSELYHDNTLIKIKLDYVYGYFVPNSVNIIKKNGNINDIKKIANETMIKYKGAWTLAKIDHELIAIFNEIHDRNLKMFMDNLNKLLKADKSKRQRLHGFKLLVKILMISTLHDFNKAQCNLSVKKSNTELSKEITERKNIRRRLYKIGEECPTVVTKAFINKANVILMKINNS